jgi:alkanesulfonate monooxygenase SsuD/methylene tetrahydromethanopterin reductase-like flavin-dependent oxidoreductase (luciferase family)
MSGARPAARVGLLAPFGLDPFDARQLDWLEQAAATGIESLWVRDLPLVDLSDGDLASGYDPFVLLAALCARLPDVRLGIAVVGADFRRPAVTAKAAASLQSLSGGRLVLGFGAGEKRASMAALGISWEERDALLAERYREVRALLTDPRSQEAVDLAPGPGYVPPPMHVATSSEAVWEAIGADAEGWMTWYRSPRELEAVRERVRAAPGCETTMAINLVLADDGPEPIEPTRVGGLAAFRVRERDLPDLLAVYREARVDRFLVSLVAPSSPLEELRRIVDAASA